MTDPSRRKNGAGDGVRRRRTDRWCNSSNASYVRMYHRGRAARPPPNPPSTHTAAVLVVAPVVHIHFAPRHVHVAPRTLTRRLLLMLLGGLPPLLRLLLLLLWWQLPLLQILLQDTVYSLRSKHLLLQRRLLEWLLLLCLLGRPCQRGHYHGCLLLLLRWLPLLLDLQLRGWLPGPRLHAGRWRDSWPAMPACRPDVQCLQDLCERWSVQHITAQHSKPSTN